MEWRTDTRVEFTEYGFYVPEDILLGTDFWLDMGYHEIYPSFQPEELMCRGGGGLRVHHDTLKAMQRLRDMINRPIVVNSYYRSPAYNKQVGGSPNSQHMAGRAVDTPLWNTLPGQIELANAAGLAGFKGVGIYKGFTHLDTGRRRTWIDQSARGKAL